MDNKTLQEKESKGPEEEPGTKTEVEKTEEKPVRTEPECTECRPMLSRCMDTVRKWLGMGQAS